MAAERTHGRSDTTPFTWTGGPPPAVVCLALALSLVFLGCPEGDDDAADDDATGDDDTGDDDTGDDDTGDDDYPPCEVDGGPSGGSGNACTDAGGVCALSAEDCTAEGATYLPDGDSGCDEEGYVCCVPPPPASQGPTCEDWGGTCSNHTGCALANGLYGPIEADASCGGQGYYFCCIPQWVCGATTQVCCAGTWWYHPSCFCGEYQCEEGDELVDEGECP